MQTWDVSGISVFLLIALIILAFLRLFKNMPGKLNREKREQMSVMLKGAKALAHCQGQAHVPGVDVQKAVAPAHE